MNGHYMLIFTLNPPRITQNSLRSFRPQPFGIYVCKNSITSISFNYRYQSPHLQVRLLRMWILFKKSHVLLLVDAWRLLPVLSLNTALRNLLLGKSIPPSQRWMCYHLPEEFRVRASIFSVKCHLQHFKSSNALHEWKNWKINVHFCIAYSQLLATVITVTQVWFKSYSRCVHVYCRPT